MAYLLEGGLTIKTQNEDNAGIYQTTEKGLEFLKDYERIKKTLDKITL